MVTNRKRIAIEGLGFGLIAGVILLAVEMLDSAVATGFPADPLRRWASIVLGFHALDSSLGTTFLAGIVVELLLTSIFGLAYAQFEWLVPAEARRHYGWQIGMGIVYAALLWMVGVAFIDQRLFPWLATSSPFRHLVLDAFFYGGGLGLMFAAAERRTPLMVKPSVG